MVSLNNPIKFLLFRIITRKDDANNYGNDSHGGYNNHRIIMIKGSGKRAKIAGGRQEDHAALGERESKVLQNNTEREREREGERERERERESQRRGEQDGWIVIAVAQRVMDGEGVATVTASAPRAPPGTDQCVGG